MTRYNWSWADYEREAAKERRRAEKEAASKLDRMEERLDQRLKDARAEHQRVSPQGISTADSASGCEGQAAAVTTGPAEPEAVVVTPKAVLAGKACQSRTLDRAVEQPSDKPATSKARPAPPPGIGEKLDLSSAPSAMEMAAESWRISEPQECDACGKKRRTPCSDGGCPML